MYNKIFVIGFNKTATTTIHKLFIKNNLTSQHNGNSWDLDSYQCFSDNGNLTNFQELDKKYPNSIFILNTRKLNKWIISRFKHGLRQSENKNRPNWAWPCTTELANKWINDREKHYLNLLEYFKNRPHKLIIVSIEKSDWTQFITSQLNLQNYDFEPRNVIELTNQHDNIIDCVNQTFNALNYTDDEKENILFKNKKTTRNYIKLYKNNIK